MEPGKEMNILVAKEVMGHDVVAYELLGDTERFVDKTGDSVWGDLRPYSEDMAADETVVEEMIRRDMLMPKPGRNTAQEAIRRPRLCAGGRYWLCLVRDCSEHYSGHRLKADAHLQLILARGFK